MVAIDDGNDVGMNVRTPLIQMDNEGEDVFQVISPTDGIIFFALTSPLVMGNMVAYKIIRRIHE